MRILIIVPHSMCVYPNDCDDGSLSDAHTLRRLTGGVIVNSNVSRRVKDYNRFGSKYTKFTSKIDKYIKSHSKVSAIELHSFNHFLVNQLNMAHSVGVIVLHTADHENRATSLVKVLNSNNFEADSHILPMYSSLGHMFSTDVHTYLTIEISRTMSANERSRCMKLIADFLNPNSTKYMYILVPVITLLASILRLI
jgi:hypothetical protein